MGGALTALAPDFTRAVLNVPAMNYSVLLPRSIDYAPFAIFINQQYSADGAPAAPSASCRCCGTAASPTATRTG